tara:strand:+ start:1331 stop:2428 length:1098 start_codon:yes stop_codon:yes gene_type:complete
MSLLKTNEIQNYNGSSLTLTASTVSTSAQLNTGGNISVTGSLNVSDDSTTRTNLGLGTIATQDSDSITVTGGTATLGALTVSGSDSGNLVRITQTGSGNALVVEDSANPDSTPFVVDSSGNVGVGTDSPSAVFHSVKSDSSAQTGAILSNNSTASGTSQAIQLDFGLARNSGTLKTDAGRIAVGRDDDWTDADTGVDSYMSFSTYKNNVLRETMRIDSSGGVTMPDVYHDAITGRDVYINSTGQLGYLSSTRDAKINIRNLESVNWIYSLNPVSFNYRTKDAADNYTEIPEEQIEYGLIAEEVELVNSDLVFYDEIENRMGLRGVQYSRLISPLVKVVQQQKALIESQQSQIDTLTARIEALETT